MVTHLARLLPIKVDVVLLHRFSTPTTLSAARIAQPRFQAAEWTGQAGVK